MQREVPRSPDHRGCLQGIRADGVASSPRASADLAWFRPPAPVVLGCILLAQFGVRLETARAAGFDPSPPDTNRGYSGGAEDARALLCAIASSDIGVAGTTFSIAALPLASGPMGPRALRNFIRDGRNQTVLGIFLGTFAYALTVLRTVEEDPFVPHRALTGAPVLAPVAVGTLVWFVPPSPRASTSRPWSTPSSRTCPGPWRSRTRNTRCGRWSRRRG